MAHKMRPVASLNVETLEPGTRTLKATIGRAALSEWIASLTLLDKQIVEIGRWTSAKGDVGFELSIDREAGRGCRARGAWRGNTLQVAITATELEMWICFYCRYLRDGFAPVNHIDVEIDATENSQFTPFLILYAEDDAAPLDPAEAKRRQGKWRR